MNPKEKAKELIDIFINVEVEVVYDGSIQSMNLRKTPAKQCALIAVDELLYDDVFDMSEELFIARITFWEEVRKEIELL